MVINIPDAHMQKFLLLIFPGVELLSFTIENSQKSINSSEETSFSLVDHEILYSHENA